MRLVMSILRRESAVESDRWVHRFYNNSSETIEPETTLLLWKDKVVRDKRILVLPLFDSLSPIGTIRIGTGPIRRGYNEIM